jgi:C1A family cysteine protease
MSHKELVMLHMRNVVVLFTLWLISAVIIVFGAVALWAEDFDWRNVGGQNFVTPVKNQNPAGTCWAFASVAALEAKYKITRNDSLFDPDISEQNLVCAGVGNVSGGWPEDSLDYFTSMGVVSEEELPYTAHNTSPSWPLNTEWQNRVWKSDSNQNDIVNTTNNYKNLLKSQGPLATSLKETGNLHTTDLYASVSALYANYHAPLSGSVTHSVLVVGFHDDAQASFLGYWIVKNSWSAYWGDDGYGYVPYGSLEIRDHTNAITGPVYYTGAVATATWQGGTGTWTVGDSDHWSKDGSP